MNLNNIKLIVWKKRETKQEALNTTNIRLYSERTHTKGTVTHSLLTSLPAYIIVTLHLTIQPCYSTVANAIC